MRKNPILIFWIAAFVLCIFVAPAQAVSVDLNVLNNNIMVGDIFAVEVWVDGEGIGEGLLGFGFDVVASGTIFTYSGYNLGPDFIFDNSDPSIPENVSGVGLAIEDDILLATLSFTADAAGIEDLTIAGLYDDLFYGLFYELSGYSLDATKEITISPVPEPATLVLLVSGLTGLGIFCRKRFGKPPGL